MRVLECARPRCTSSGAEVIRQTVVDNQQPNQPQRHELGKNRERRRKPELIVRRPAARLGCPSQHAATITSAGGLYTQHGITISLQQAGIWQDAKMKRAPTRLPPEDQERSRGEQDRRGHHCCLPKPPFPRRLRRRRWLRGGRRHRELRGDC